jgi:hypothetical protein
MTQRTRVHFSRDGQKSVCGRYRPGDVYDVTSDPAKVTCRRTECLREAGVVENHSPWRHEYQ